MCAAQLAGALPLLLPPPPRDVVDRRRLLAEELLMATGGRCSRGLVDLCRLGVAFHHAGLTSQVRGGFRNNMA